MVDELTAVSAVGCRHRVLQRGRVRMERYFGGGKSSPPPPVIPPPPKEEDPAVQQAAAEAARRKKVGRGYRSTILGSLYQAGQGSGQAGTNQPGQSTTFGA